MTEPAHIIEEYRPRVTKLSRHRSLEQQRCQPSTAKTHFTNVIHITIRPLSNNPVIHDKPLKHNADINPYSTSTVIHDHRNDLQQPSTAQNFIGSSKRPRRSVSVTSLRRHRHSPLQSSQNIRRKNNSNRITPQQGNHSIKTVDHPEFKDEIMSKSRKLSTKSSKTNNIHDQQHIHTPNEWFDCNGITKEHHRNPDQNKKKKCSHLCIIVSLLIGFLIIITIIVVLTVLLIKPKTITAKPTNIELRWNSTGQTVAGILGSGVAADRLNSPFGLAVDYANTLYIAEFGGHRVQRWLMRASTGTTVAGQANISSSISLNYLSSPAGILIDSDSNLYIADSGNSRILFWPKNASSGQLIAGTGALGNLSNELYTSFCISRDWNLGVLYVADYGNHRIMRYGSNATSGNVVAGGNGAGANFTQLYSPTAVYFDSLTNSLLIVNYIGANVVRWTIGDNSWSLVAGSTNLSTGTTATLLNGPVGITVDPMGNIYVADALNHRIQFFLAGQSVGKTIAGITNVPGSNSTLLASPYGITLDNQLNLYVADTGHHRVQKFLRY